MFIQHSSVICDCFSPLACDIEGPEGEARLQYRLQFNLFLNIVEPLSFLLGLKPDATNVSGGQEPNVAYVASKFDILCSSGFTIDCNCFQVALSSTPTTKLVHKIRGDKEQRVIKIMKSLLYRILHSAVVNRRFFVTAASKMSRLYWSRSSMLYALFKAKLEARLPSLPG